MNFHGAISQRDGNAWLSRDCVAYHAAMRPEALAVAVLTDGSRWSYRALDAEIDRRAAGLAAKVSARGARIAILARNSLEHVLYFYAAARAGLVFVPLNWRLAAPELKGLVEDCTVELLFADDEFAPAAEEVAQGRFPVLRLKDGLPDGPPPPWADLTPEEPWVLLYTSGTTGRPKGAIISRRTAFFSAFNFGQVGSVTPGCATLADAPMFHTVGLMAITHAGLTAGATVLISDRFVPSVTLQRLSDPALAVTHYFCVPQMAQAMLQDPAYETSDLSNLRGFFTGGAPLPVAVARRLLNDGVPLSNGYGSTEGGTLMHVPINREIGLAKIGSCGVPAPAVEVRLVGTDGKDVARGEVGEIWLRGPAVTPGYWAQPEATAATFHEDWFRTGDAGRQDEDGFYSLVDRWKDMYISGGENVYPAEVEAALLEIEGVLEASVVGAPDARWGEVGVAYLVLKHPAAVDEAAVVEHCKARLAGYKRPAAVRFLEALPRNAAGKVRKPELRSRYAEEKS